MSYTVEARRILLIYGVLGHNAMPTYGKLEYTRWKY